MASIQAGRWTERFQLCDDYEAELKAAIEIPHRWKDSGTQIAIELDRLPGWLTPLWSLDGGWLYIRRPEGVWKTRLPNARPGLPVVFCQRFADGSIRGDEFIGEQLSSTGRWMRGPGEPKSPVELDCESSPEGSNADADEIANPLFNVIENTPERYVMSAGELFDRPPSATFDGNWVICRDESTGWRIAYGVDSHPHVRRALREGRLWLRFSGPYMDPFMIHVGPQEN
jgi:hypothetical protein